LGVTLPDGFVDQPVSASVDVGLGEHV
ncbi:MAG: hypothetical protein QOE61_1084, partial [Micromonosporaceae bacterium]|nr:hypothetical protein [Micromonosporaceae bacterium]